MTSEDLNRAVDEILVGSFDLHVHAGPEPGKQRRMDALDTGRHAHEAEMSGFVLKAHTYPTAPLAQALNRIYPGLRATGAIVLNSQVGGINPDAVEASADLGARVVWMPTESAGDLPVADQSGNLSQQVHEVLDIVQSHDMVLASGHISLADTLALFKEARARGIGRMIATHPSEIASTEEIREIVSLGAYAEFTFRSCMPSDSAVALKEMVAAVRTVGIGRCVVTTDFGLWMDPPPAEGMRIAIANLLNAGLTPEEVSTLVKANPLQLIGD